MNAPSARTVLSVVAISTLAALASTASDTPSAAPPGEAPAPPVEELVFAALARSPSVAALQARLAAAREMVSPAGALPDPMVALTMQDMSFPKWTVGTDPMSMVGPEFQQDLPFPGKRAARREAAGAETTVREAEVDQLRREIAMQVRSLYGRVYALDRERQFLHAAREMLDMLAATSASRYSVGDADQEAVLKAQLEISRVGERLDDVAAERSALVAALDRLMDAPAATPLGEVRVLPTATVAAPPWDELAVRTSAAVAAKRAAVAAAEKRVAAARLDLRPDFTTGAAVGLRGGFDPAVTLRFGLTYPLWRSEKQRPLLAAAEDGLAVAHAELRDAEAGARSAAATLEAEWSRTERQVARYRQAILPQSSAAVDAARAAYLVGRGDFLTVIDDFDRWLDARVKLARREADRFATWAEVEALFASPVAAQAQREE